MKNLILPALLFLCFACSRSDQYVMDLAAEWRFQMDESDLGIDQEWFDTELPGRINLPGSMMEAGLGKELSLQTQWTASIYDSSWFFNPDMEPYRQPGQLKFPFWLTPPVYYVGPAWYQRELLIPADWEGRQLILSLERPHWESQVWVNSEPAGLQNSLSVAHEYDLTKLLKPGKNRLTLRIDNRVKDIKPGPDSHSISDHTQGNWNGIVGEIKLFARSTIMLSDVQVYPDPLSGRVRLVCSVDNRSGEPCEGELLAQTRLFNVEEKDGRSRTEQKAGPYKAEQKAGPQKAGFPVQLSPGKQSLEFVLEMGEERQLWDEFHPALYKLTVELRSDKAAPDRFETQFGFRSFTTGGTRFLINGRPVFLRGTVECAAHPLTGYAPMDKAYWRDLYQKAKAYGVNHFRFHSWCPPRAAFEAADELGIYLQPEGPFWTNHGTAVGNGWPIDQYIRGECDRILRAYGNHPSFVMFAYGNEPAGRHQITFLNGLVDYWKEQDPRRLYTHASIGGSWPLAPSNEFIVRSGSRGLPWERLPNSEFDYSGKIAPFQVPYVAHEMGQYCVFPNFDEIPKYTGVYQAKNFEMFKEELERKNMGPQARDFFMATGKFQAICYKNEIEASLRTPGNGGTQLLSLNDFPGQGSALVGVTDVFWEPKDYITADEFRRFFSPTVPITRFPKFVFCNDEQLSVAAEVAHFGPEILKNQVPEWKVCNDEGKTIAQGKLPATEIGFGNVPLGSISLPLDFAREAGQYKLALSLGKFSNQWDFWVYPASLPAADTTGIVLTDDYKQAAEQAQKGASVLLLAAGKVEKGKEVVQYFRPVFWNTSWFQMRPPHTLGILANPGHPALSAFPTEYHSNLQWWELLHNQQVMNLDNFPAGFVPIVQPIDTWFINRKLGLIFEARLGPGRLIVCSADITSDPDQRIVARQMRHSLLSYMNSEQFAPAFEITEAQLSELFEPGHDDSYDVRTSDSPMDLKP
ncbi:MAG: glycoside hydrolase family 2 TIM barrel-domain containing protein [Bacteroidales bacterium]|nr:glycoside hydrolase family 2 TIM barrel-domain containing protein [Bacteroidales bacterium]